MPDDEELFDHQVTVLTVGDLRKALEGIPDDFPVTIAVAEEPGGDTADMQVAISAGPWNDQGAEGVPADHFEIGSEFPSGQYYRRTR
jgi:hypothetical protein